MNQAKLASEVDLPIVVYVNPARTKNPLLPKMIPELRRRMRDIVEVKRSYEESVKVRHLLAPIGINADGDGGMQNVRPGSGNVETVRQRGTCGRGVEVGSC